MLSSAWATHICSLLSSLCHIVTLMPNLEFSEGGLKQFEFFRKETEAFPIFSTLFICLNNFKGLPQVTKNFVSHIVPVIIWVLILGWFITYHLNIPVEKFIHSPELRSMGVFWLRVCKDSVLAASMECDPPVWHGELQRVPLFPGYSVSRVSASSSETGLNLCLVVCQKNCKDTPAALISPLQSLPSCN